MSPAAVAEFLDSLQRITAFALALMVILALLTERLVPKGRLEEMRKQRDALIEKVHQHDADAERRVDERVARIEGRVDALADRVKTRNTRAPPTAD